MNAKQIIPQDYPNFAVNVENSFTLQMGYSISFGEILNKYASTGQSCEIVLETIKSLLNNQIPNINVSSFRLVVHYFINNNLTNFRIHGMGRKHLSLEKRNTRTAIAIEKAYAEKFNVFLSFGDILDKHARIGESCDTIMHKLMNMLNIKLAHSSFGNAVRLCIAQGKTNFLISGKVQGNKFRKTGTGLANRIRYIFCKQCGARYKSTHDIILRADSCKICYSKDIVVIHKKNGEYIKEELVENTLVAGVKDLRKHSINFPKEEKRKYI